MFLDIKIFMTLKKIMVLGQYNMDKILMIRHFKILSMQNWNDWCLYLVPAWPLQWRSGSAQNWKTRGSRFKPRSRLSTQPFGIFCVFLRNSRKYRLGSFRKISTQGIPLLRPSPTCGQLALFLQPNPTFLSTIFDR